MSFSREGLGFQRRKKSTRKIGDAPTIGHVPRMHKNARGLRARLSYAGRIPLILLALAIFGLGAGLAALVLRFANDPSKQLRPVVSLAALPPSPHAIPQVPVPEPQELERVVHAFLAARTPQDLAPLIRGTTQRPEDIARKLSLLETIDGKLASVRYMGPIDSRCLQVEGVLVKFDTGRNRLALVAPDKQGEWRVDFDAFDRHVTPDWETILSRNPAESTVRVYVAKDTYYNGRYQDDRQWACFSLASPDHDSLMFGYVPRGSRQHMAIASAIQRNLDAAKGSLKRMTVSILHTGTGDRRQFEITRALADDWALGDEPLDARVDASDAASAE